MSLWTYSFRFGTEFDHKDEPPNYTRVSYTNDFLFVIGLWAEFESVYQEWIARDDTRNLVEIPPKSLENLLNHEQAGICAYSPGARMYRLAYCVGRTPNKASTLNPAGSRSKGKEFASEQVEEVDKPERDSLLAYNYSCSEGFF